ncbi:MAG: ABC transporter ATP-binding protein [Pseudomonadota bacterium]
MSNPQSVLELRDVERTYGELKVLLKSNLVISSGETVGLLGPSGSGKSSLLHMAGLLESPSHGDVLIDGHKTRDLDDAQRTALRREALGFVYQAHHLLPEFSALGNVALPLLIAGHSQSRAEERATSLLERLGLGQRLSHQPGQLSGGEQQRTAIARALANQPRVLLADEPTGNLDPKTSDLVFDAFLELVRGEGLAALIATHDHRLARRMDRVVTIRNQTIIEIGTDDPALSGV